MPDESSNIKRIFVAAIERTGNPLAPIIMQEAHRVVEQLGSLMASIADEKKTRDFSDELLRAFPEEMSAISKDPSFLCALCALTSQSLIEYGSSLKEPVKG